MQEATAAFEEAARLMPDAPKYRRSVEALAAAVEQRELRRGYEARLISEWERQAQGEAAGRAQQEQEEAEYAMADRLEEGRAWGAWFRRGGSDQRGQ